MIPTPRDGGARNGGAYIYLIRSRLDGSCYVGWTTDVARRLVEHNAGLSSFSRRKRAWQLIGVERCANPTTTKARERALKRSLRQMWLFKKRMLNQAAGGGQHRVWG